MQSRLTNYQCPSCTGPLRFDEGSGLLQCDYCGSTYTPAEMEKLYGKDPMQNTAQAASAEVPESGETSSGASEWWDGEREGMRLYNCPSCGAELVFDATTAASSCPYCGNPTVVQGQFQGLLRPDYILPFRISRDEALRTLQKYYKGKPLLPKQFSSQNHLEEIKGVYVPFWLFDEEAVGDMRYQATRVFTTQHGDEIVTTTEYYDVRRAGSIRFRRIPADGSSKMPDDLMDSIEPFDYSDLKPFSTAYMPGFMADIYDVDDKKSFERAKTRGSNTAEQIFDSSVSGYSSVTATSRNLQMHRERTAYALMPVWMLTTRWGGKNFVFAMNGQTGKFVGDLPVSTGKYLAWFAGIAVPLAGLIALLTRL